MAKKKSKEAVPQDPAAAALAMIQEEFGTESIMDLEGEGQQIDAIPSGSIGVDRILGIGGYPRGRIIEIYGPESSGKTTLTLHAAAEAQKLGLLVGFIDAEHALDTSYAEALGVDLSKSKFLLSQPDSGEIGLNIVEKMCKSGAFGLIIVDSVAALTPQAELDGEIGDTHVGLQARMMSQAMRILRGRASMTNTTIIFINQLRMKIGVKFGSPETTPGGNALKFYASQRLDVRRIGGLKDAAADESTQFVGNRTRVKVVKNKVAPPFKEYLFDITYGIGIDRAAELIELGVDVGIVKKAGTWLEYDGTKHQGRNKFIAALREDADLAARLDEAVRAAL